MKLSLSFWLALTAIILALSAVAARLAMGKADSFGEVIGPIAIALLMFGILSNEWAKSRAGR
jgi:hypothetical protein